MLKYAIGIDVSKDTLQVCFMGYREDFSGKIIGARKFSNGVSGIKAFIKWIETKRKNKDLVLAIGMEATGVYHQHVAHSLHDAGYGLSILVPGRVKAYFRSIGIVSKNDPTDAKGLAQMMLQRNERLWTPPTKQIRELRSLYRYRDGLQDQLTQVRNKTHAESHSFDCNKYIIKQLDKQTKHLGDQVEKVDKQIEKLLDQNSEFSRKVNQIAGSIGGVGVKTVGQIAAEFDGFSLITSQSQITSFAGYDVIENQSGLRSGKTRISKRGNRHIRKALHFPSINVVRFEQDIFKQLYDRVFDRTKIKMKGYVAVQRKLLCIIYALWKNDTAFVKNYKQKQEEQADIGENIIEHNKAA